MVCCLLCINPLAKPVLTAFQLKIYNEFFVLQKRNQSFSFYLKCYLQMLAILYKVAV